VCKSQRVAFSGVEWLAPAAAVGISIWCMAKPLGGPKVELTKPAHLLGTFVSRTSWGLLLIGTVLTIGAETIAGYTYDAELEKTHAYTLFLLLIPGLILVWLNLIPLLHRGSEFRVEADGSVMVRRGDRWEPLLEYQYSSVTADGRTIDFTPPTKGPPAVVFPQSRVFCREYGARLKSELTGQFFSELLARCGFDVDAGTSKSGFTARRR
jgi:hypothetical protein